MNRADDPVTAQDDLTIAKLNVPIRDGSRIAVTLYHCTPAADERLPLLMYVHGGGFVTGSLETDDSACRVIALRVGIADINAESTNFPLVFKTRSTFCDGYTSLSPHINSIVYGCVVDLGFIHPSPLLLMAKSSGHRMPSYTPNTKQLIAQPPSSPAFPSRIADLASLLARLLRGAVFPFGWLHMVTPQPPHRRPEDSDSIEYERSHRASRGWLQVHRSLAKTGNERFVQAIGTNWALGPKPYG
ncbi:hypothetical protein MHUMG1_00741 [Metarhizium humberi]|uniref:Alpha/beta hydrolase fold-3 domain-containing protein n=1 Tax=Metarhizium humberi TaxID=2596975 RepID=A0A9P8SC57_9HYPO|nr:hypothetical protein MHUMG1_00741 [Metarhizium humberi]